MTGTLWWDFDGTLVSRPAMWSEAGHLLLTERCPHLGIERETLGRELQSGFPWHHPERDHTRLATAAAWWDAVDHRFADAFVGLGWVDAHLARPFGRLRECILAPERYRVFDDVEPVLSLLRERGWRHVIVSNHVPELASLVEDLGLADWFDAVVTSAQVGFEKPHPRLFEAARAASPDPRIWMIGDNPIADVAGARSAGIDAILVRTRHDVSPRADDLWGVAAILDSRTDAAPSS